MVVSMIDNVPERSFRSGNCQNLLPANSIDDRAVLGKEAEASSEAVVQRLEVEWAFGRICA